MENFIVTARGTSAIFLALKALGEGGEVILPATTCADVLYGVKFAGMRPVLANITLSDFTIDPESVAQNLSRDTRAIIAIHLFGHICAMKEIRRAAGGIPILEDTAQSLGGESTGEFGDFGIMSFGKGKMLDLGGGGAILTNDSAVAGRIRCLQQYLPHCRSKKLAVLCGPAYHLGTVFRPVLRALPHLFESLYLYAPSGITDEVVLEGLAELESQKRRRMEAIECYRNQLTSAEIVHPRVPNGSNLWRYSVLIRSTTRRNAIRKRLRRLRIEVSSLYPSLKMFVPRSNVPNSEYAERHILNLQVAPGFDFSRCANAVNEVLISS